MNQNLFKPRDPNFESRVRESFVAQSAMATLGFELARVEAGQVEIQFSHRDDLTQQHGFMHGGIIATAADNACGFSALTLMSSDKAVLSVEFKINFMAPARGDRFRAVARVVKSGATLTICNGEVLAINEEKETPVALVQATLISLDSKRAGIQN